MGGPDAAGEIAAASPHAAPTTAISATDQLPIF
jgi:hypothetical protein